VALIVVVDDEVVLTIILADALEEEGHEVVTASHGREALELIRRDRPDLVITDFMMPHMTGLELAQAVHSEHALADLPMILASGAQGAIGRERGDQFTFVLDKPYLMTDMLAAVSGVLKRPIAPTCI